MNTYMFFCEFVIPNVLSLFDAKIHCEKSNPSIFEIMSKKSQRLKGEIKDG